MDAIEAVKQLKARYCRTMDTKDWAAMRELFTDDVVIDTTGSGGGVVTGADAFIDFLREVLADQVTVHHCHMPEITVSSPSEATGIWAMEDRIVWADGSQLLGFGHYHETYTKLDGRWQISSSRLTRLRLDVIPAPTPVAENAG